jgi:hypothetical protein
MGRPRGGADDVGGGQSQDCRGSKSTLGEVESKADSDAACCAFSSHHRSTSSQTANMSVCESVCSPI